MPVSDNGDFIFDDSMRINSNLDSLISEIFDHVKNDPTNPENRMYIHIAKRIAEQRVALADLTVQVASLYSPEHHKYAVTQLENAQFSKDDLSNSFQDYGSR